MKIEWGLAESPFGWCSLGWNHRGICHLGFHDGDDQPDEPREIRKNWPEAILTRNDAGARSQTKKIFQGDPAAATRLKAFVRATPFQLKVWRALLRIPEGHLASYRTLADAVGNPAAARAVGTACGSNPIACLIPCHRVIRETGVIEGYHWGSVRKRAMLAWESSRAAEVEAGVAAGVR